MKNLKKIFSICLALLMLLTVPSVAFATEETNGTCPVIHIPGINSSTVYADMNDPESEIAIPDKDTILKMVEKKLIPALVTFSADEDVDKLAGVISAELNKLFADWFNESTGDAKENSGVVFNSKPSHVTSASKLIFRYDWRGDPIAIANDLNAYINHVISVSGCDKVALTCHSLGSAVVLSYLTSYGNSKISAIVYDTPACNGVAVVGNLLTGKVTLDSDAIAYFLQSTMGEAEYESLTASIVDLFSLAGVPELFTLFADMIIKELSPVLYKETIAPLFGYWLSIWAMVPDAQVDEAMTYIFDNLLKDKDLSYLKARIELYNNTIRKNREATLKAFDAKGNFAVITRYGSPSFPLTNAAKLTGDTVIETRASSLGATTAPIGDYFSDKQLEGTDARYISPDKTVNASTCMFPEKTWFIKNTTHFESEMTEKYYDMFLFSAEELTCDTAKIGRFTYYDRANDTLTEDTTTPQKAEKVSPWKRFINFFRNLFDRLAAFFDKIFG